MIVIPRLNYFLIFIQEYSHYYFFMIFNPVSLIVLIFRLFRKMELAANDVGGLQPFWSGHQVVLHGLALIQGAIAIFLNHREMYEYILSCGALDKSISFRPIEPLHSPLLAITHCELLINRCRQSFC